MSEDCGRSDIGYEDGTHIVADETRVESFTRAGWRLVQVMTCSAPVPYLAQPMKHGDHTNGYTMTPEVRVEQIGAALRFLLVKGRETEETEFREQIASLQADLRAQAERIATLTKDGERAAKATAEVVQEAARERQRATENFKALNDERALHREALKESSQKLECAEDRLATIRAALGDLQMKEILGTAVPF
jgi:hypothetical protein